MKFTELAKNLQNGISPVYLIEGDEAYFRDHAVEFIRKACALTQPVLNDVRYEGEEIRGNLAAFRDELFTLPFFDEKRIARVYDFYPTEREWGILKGYCEKPCQSTVLLIVNGGKKSGAVDLKRKTGIAYVDCSRADEEELSRWLFGVMRRANLNADADAAALMVRFCARDAARLKKETEKLALALGEGGRVTRSVVEEYVAKDAEYAAWQLTQAASKKNAAQFFEILSDMLEKGNDEIRVLSSLTAYFRTLCDAGRLKGTDAEVCKLLGLKSAYPLQKNREIYRLLGAEKCEEYYLRLYELSSGAKSGLYSKTGALSAAIAKIFFD